MIKDLMLPTKQLDPAVKQLVMSLKPGDKIRIVQKIRVGAKTWTATAAGTFRDVNYLSTGLSTDRVPEDDIVVPTIHFTKDNGELSSVSMDENTQVERG